MIRVFLIFILAAAITADAQEPRRAEELAPLQIPRVTRPPKLSDFLDNVPREAELVIREFWQMQPGDGDPVSQPTEAFLSYDDKNLYAAFICKEDMKLMRARYTRREDVFRDDRVSLCIDTFHDKRHIYWFDVNPYGVQAEGTAIDGVEDSKSWDTLWYTDTKVLDDGYVVLITLPFKSIRFPADEEQTWGLIIGRWIARSNEYGIWPWVSKRRPGFVQQAGDLTGFRGISPGRNIQLIPYGFFSRSRYLDTTPGVTPQFKKETEARAGLDAKMIIKDAMTLDVTLNPDFSQVESDEPQVTVNQRYEVFFPEKRPFFLENAGYFKTPEQLFFSRRIIDPQFGARLTGRVGKWSLGFLGVDDRAPGEQAAVDSPLREKRTGVGVARIQRDITKFGGNSNVAGMVTSWDFGSTHNRVYSFDTRLQLLKNWIFSGQAMSSDTRFEDGRRLNGPAYILKWEHAGRHFISETTYTDRSPSFRSALGFFDRVDIRELNHGIGYQWRPEESAVQEWGPVVTAAINYNREGRIRDWYVNPNFQVTMDRLTAFSIGRMETYELFQNRGFRFHENRVMAESEPTRWFGFEAMFGNGKGINYYPGSSMEPFLADMRQATAGITLRPTVHLRIDETYLYSSLKANGDISAPGVATGTTIFNNHIVRSKANYQFDTRASVRAIVDYNGVLPNHKLISLERSKHIGLDLLFTYLLNPGTALYVGYTDLYENYRLDPTRSPELYRTDFPDLSTGRQFFVKLSYLFRF